MTFSLQQIYRIFKFFDIVLRVTLNKCILIVYKFCIIGKEKKQKNLKIAWQPTINLKIRKSKNITDVYLDNEMWFTHKIFYFDHYIYNCLKHIYVYTNMRKTCYYKTYLIQTLSYNKFTTNSMHTYTHTQSHTHFYKGTHRAKRQR